MTNIMKPPSGGGALATPGDILANLKRDRAITPKARGGGMGDFLRFSKGRWSYGAQNFEAGNGEAWVVNPATFGHGYISWHQNAVEWESYVPSHETAASDPGKPLLGKDGLQEQRGVQMALLPDEEDAEGEAVTCTFKGNSMGIREALEILRDAILDHDGDDIFPVVELEVDSYMHSQHGRVYKPVLKIVDWMTAAEALGVAGEAAEADAEEAEAEEAEAAPEQPPRRRSAEAKVAEAEDVVDETLPGGQAPRRRGRRPAA